MCIYLEGVFESDDMAKNTKLVSEKYRKINDNLGDSWQDQDVLL